MSRIPTDLTQFTPRKILVCQLKQIGDVLLMTPVPELLARRFPQAEVHVLTEKKCVSLLEHNPHIHTVWSLDPKALSSLPKEIVWYWRVARQDFDLVIDLQQTPRCRWVVAFSKIRGAARLSYTAPWYTSWLYTHTTPVRKAYASAMKAQALEPLGITWNGEKPRIYLTDAEKAAAASYLASLGLAPGQTLITVDPTHRRPTRRWPGEYYARLIDLAAAQNPALRFLLLYGPGEETELRAVTEACVHQEALLVPERVISLRESAACIAAARLHLGNCSAPRHMAVALDTPTFTILGATGRGWTYPSPEHAHTARILPCQPCNKNICSQGDCPCLTGFTPEKMLPLFMEHLESL